MAGCSTMCITPVTASTMNHSRITGPNSRPTVAVPNRCNANSATRIASDTGTTYAFNAGVATSRPSIAPSTEIAGVITLSP